MTNDLDRALIALRVSRDHGHGAVLNDAEVPALLAEIDRLTRELAESRVERDAMAKDAARYRWLRGDSCPDHSSRWTQWEVRCWKAPSWTGDLRRADLDDAIDAARGKE